MKGTIWVVDDDGAIRWVLERALQSNKFHCQTFTHADSLFSALLAKQPDVVICDIRMPDVDGFTLLNQLQIDYPKLPVIIITAHSDLESAVGAYERGAFDYLPKPFDIKTIISLVERAIIHSQEQKIKSKKENIEESKAELIGAAPSMQEVFRAIGRLARSSISVLINGESGTGKELVAQALHRHSPRKDQAFIALNMAAIPKDLIESELFGHEKGAFTGAQTVRQGRFEQANGGTLFLDEIGDMPIDVQTRLLRVLADGQFYRVGGHQPIKVDVRIIAATHQNLEKRVATGDFREDLFHRLNVIRLKIPPLRERREDIKALSKYFLAKAAKELSVETKRLHKDTLAIMQQLAWQGNVRQLENICRLLTVMGSTKEILPEDLPAELLKPAQQNPSDIENWQQALSKWAEQALKKGSENILTDALAEFESILLKVALKHTNGHKQEAAKLLGWGRNTLTRKIAKME